MTSMEKKCMPQAQFFSGYEGKIGMKSQNLTNETKKGLISLILRKSKPQTKFFGGFFSKIHLQTLKIVIFDTIAKIQRFFAIRIFRGLNKNLEDFQRFFRAQTPCTAVIYIAASTTKLHIQPRPFQGGLGSQRWLPLLRRLDIGCNLAKLTSSLYVREQCMQQMFGCCNSRNIKASCCKI